MGWGSGVGTKRVVSTMLSGSSEFQSIFKNILGIVRSRFTCPERSLVLICISERNSMSCGK